MLMPDPYLSANADNVTHHEAEADSRAPSPTVILPHPHLMAVVATVVTAITAVPVVPVVPVVPAVATVQVAPVVPAVTDCMAPADVDVGVTYNAVPIVDAAPIEAVTQTVAEAPTEVAAQAATVAYTVTVALTTSGPTHPHPALAILHVAAALTEATRNTGRLDLWEAGWYLARLHTAPTLMPTPSLAHHLLLPLLQHPHTHSNKHTNPPPS
jgi:hypothetical protein